MKRGKREEVKLAEIRRGNSKHTATFETKQNESERD